MDHALDRDFMEKALELARYAGSLGEVPVGAIVVVKGEIIGAGFNRRELRNSCLEHAEINALKDASSRLGAWRLLGSTVYSTLEPCIMCSGALLHARVSRLVYGARDPKFGGIESLYNLASDQRLNHQFETLGGIGAEECTALLQKFFRALRLKSAPG